MHSAEEEEIRAAIAQYNELKAEYDRVSALHQESYQRYQGMYGYQLDAIEGPRDLAMRDKANAENAAAEAQARADAYGAADPPDLEAQAQAQAEADAFRQQAAQKQAEIDAYNQQWSQIHANPDLQAAYNEFTDYAVQSNALGTQMRGAYDRVQYLQNLYGIYLM